MVIVSQLKVLYPGSNLCGQPVKVNRDDSLKYMNVIHFTFINTLFSLWSYTYVGHMFTVLCSYAKLLLLIKQVMKVIKN